MGERPDKSWEDDDAEAGDVHEALAGTAFVWSFWLRKYAFRLALGLACLLLGAGRGDVLLMVIGAGNLLRPLGGAIAFSGISGRVKRPARALIRAGDVAFFVFCGFVLLRAVMAEVGT